MGKKKAHKCFDAGPPKIRSCSKRPTKPGGPDRTSLTKQSTNRGGSRVPPHEDVAAWHGTSGETRAEEVSHETPRLGAVLRRRIVETFEESVKVRRTQSACGAQFCHMPPTTRQLIPLRCCKGRGLGERKIKVLDQLVGVEGGPRSRRSSLRCNFEISKLKN